MNPSELPQRGPIGRIPPDAILVDSHYPVIREFLKHAILLGMVRTIHVGSGRVALLPTELWKTPRDPGSITP